VAGFVVGVEDGAVHAACDLDPLAEGVVDRDLGGGAIRERLQTGVVVGGGDGGIAGGVAGRIIGIRALELPNRPHY